MSRSKPYELIYDTEVHGHLSKIERKYHSLIRQNIEEMLPHEPETETRNRMPLMRPSILGTAWELHFGPDNSFRVFYRVDRKLRQVYVLAIGVKKKEKLFVGGKEFRL